MTYGIVRLATPDDAESIVSCLKLMHEENGLFTLNETKMRSIINSSLQPDPSVAFPPTIGVIGDAGNVEATICLALSQLYYTDEWHLGDLWIFIRPDARKKGYIHHLASFAKKISDDTGVPLMTGVVSNKRTEAKVRIYKKHYGDPLGAIFLHKPNKAA